MRLFGRKKGDDGSSRHNRTLDGSSRDKRSLLGSQHKRTVGGSSSNHKRTSLGDSSSHEPKASPTKPLHETAPPRTKTKKSKPDKRTSTNSRASTKSNSKRTPPCSPSAQKPFKVKRSDYGGGNGGGDNSLHRRPQSSSTGPTAETSSSSVESNSPMRPIRRNSKGDGNSSIGMEMESNPGSPTHFPTTATFVFDDGIEWPKDPEPIAPTLIGTLEPTKGQIDWSQHNHEHDNDDKQRKKKRPSKNSSSNMAPISPKIVKEKARLSDWGRPAIATDDGGFTDDDEMVFGEFDGQEFGDDDSEEEEVSIKSMSGHHRSPPKRSQHGMQARLGAGGGGSKHSRSGDVHRSSHSRSGDVRSSHSRGGEVRSSHSRSADVHRSSHSRSADAVHRSSHSRSADAVHRSSHSRSADAVHRSSHSRSADAHRSSHSRSGDAHRSSHSRSGDAQNRSSHSRSLDHVRSTHSRGSRDLTRNFAESSYEEITLEDSTVASFESYFEESIGDAEYDEYLMRQQQESMSQLEYEDFLKRREQQAQQTNDVKNTTTSKDQQVLKGNQSSTSMELEEAFSKTEESKSTNDGQISALTFDVSESELISKAPSSGYTFGNKPPSANTLSSRSYGTGYFTMASTSINDVNEPPPITPPGTSNPLKLAAQLGIVLDEPSEVEDDADDDQPEPPHEAALNVNHDDSYRLEDESTSKQSDDDDTMLIHPQGPISAITFDVSDSELMPKAPSSYFSLQASATKKPQSANTLTSAHGSQPTSAFTMTSINDINEPPPITPNGMNPMKLATQLGIVMDDEEEEDISEDSPKLSYPAGVHPIYKEPLTSLEESVESIHPPESLIQPNAPASFSGLEIEASDSQKLPMVSPLTVQQQTGKKKNMNGEQLPTMSPLTEKAGLKDPNKLDKVKQEGKKCKKSKTDDTTSKAFKSKKGESKKKTASPKLGSFVKETSSKAKKKKKNEGEESTCVSDLPIVMTKKKGGEPVREQTQRRQVRKIKYVANKKDGPEPDITDMGTVKSDGTRKSKRGKKSGEKSPTKQSKRKDVAGGEDPSSTSKKRSSSKNKGEDNATPGSVDKERKSKSSKEAKKSKSRSSKPPNEDKASKSKAKKDKSAPNSHANELDKSHRSKGNNLDKSHRSKGTTLDESHRSKEDLDKSHRSKEIGKQRRASTMSSRKHHHEDGEKRKTSKDKTNSSEEGGKTKKEKHRTKSTDGKKRSAKKTT